MAIELKSKFCLTPDNCYPVVTEIPTWAVAVLLGSTLFLIKEIYNLLTN